MFKGWNLKAIDFEVEHAIYLAQMHVLDSGEERIVPQRSMSGIMEKGRGKFKMAPIYIVVLDWIPKYERVALGKEPDSAYQVFTQWRYVVGSGYHKSELDQLINEAKRVATAYADPVDFVEKELNEK